jgi:hypothetical protein
MRRSSTRCCPRHEPEALTESDTKLDLVTGPFSYSGAHIAAWLVASGRQVRTLTFHPERHHPPSRQVQALRYRFDDPLALARALEGVATLYNWLIAGLTLLVAALLAQTRHTS